MTKLIKLSILSLIFAAPLSFAEPVDTPAAERQVPNMDSDQMKVPEPVYDTEGETQGAIRFDGTTVQKESAQETINSEMTSPESIRQAQENLNRFGYDLQVDGIMGPQTQAAVREFQMTTGLMTTGQLNEATIDALSAQSSETFERAPASLNDPDSMQDDGAVDSDAVTTPEPAVTPGTRPNGTND